MTTLLACYRFVCTNSEALWGQTPDGATACAR